MDWKKFLKLSLKKVLLAIIILYAISFLLINSVYIVANSMAPAIGSGSLIFYTTNLADGIEEGDVIVYKVPAREYPIAHRVYEINDEGIKTKGDNNINVDPWVITEEYIIGKMRFSIPLLGYIFGYPPTIISKIILSYLLSCLIIFGYNKYTKKGEK